MIKYLFTFTLIISSFNILINDCFCETYETNSNISFDDNQNGQVKNDYTIPTPPPPPPFPQYDPSKIISKKEKSKYSNAQTQNFQMSMLDQIIMKREELNKKRQQSREQINKEIINNNQLKQLAKQPESMRGQLEERMQQRRNRNDNNLTTNLLKNAAYENVQNYNKKQKDKPKKSNISKKELIEKVTNMYSNLLKSARDLQNILKIIIDNQ